MLDVKTLIISITAISLFSPVLYYLLHRSGSLVGGTLQWTIASIFSAIGLCLVLLKGAAAPALLTVVGANTAFALSYGIGWIGMRIFVERPPLYRAMWSLVLVQFLLTIWFTYVSPSQTACSTLVALVVALFCILIAQDLFRGALALRRPMRIYGSVVYALQALVMLVRIVLLQTLPLEGAYFKWGAINEVMFLWNIIFVFSLLAAILLMVSEKLQAEIKTLRGIVPICAHCKKIRDDQGYWQQVEQYVTTHSEARFSHGICPECMDQARAELEDLKGRIRR